MLPFQELFPLRQMREDAPSIRKHGLLFVLNLFLCWSGRLPMRLCARILHPLRIAFLALFIVIRPPF